MHTILVVDDNRDFCVLLEFALKSRVDDGELKLLFATNGVEALEIINRESENIHLVLTDISMPEMDGLELLEKVNEQNPYIKAIVMSGYRDMGYIRRAMNAGAYDYLLKPVNLDELEEVISRAINRSDVVREALRDRVRLFSIERELTVAGEIQQSMLPQKFPAFAGSKSIDIAAGMNPAKEVGGDFYDFFAIDNELFGFVIGDVSGKGIPAALLMALTRTLIRAYAQQGLGANQVLSLVNNTIAQDNKLAMFVTSFFGILKVETGEIEYCNAAHVVPLIKKLDGTVTQINCTGNMALGMLPDMQYKVNTMTLQQGETLVLFTDGITEARSTSEEMFGDERLQQAVHSSDKTISQEIMMDVLHKVYTFTSGAEQNDDIGVVVLTLGNSTE